jgi:hypothetical protein
MKRRAYRRTAIKQFEPTVIREKTESNRLVLAIDVAKEDMVAALADERAEVLVTLAWKHLDDTAELLAKLDELNTTASDSTWRLRAVCVRMIHIALCGIDFGEEAH